MNQPESTMKNGILFLLLLLLTGPVGADTREEAARILQRIDQNQNIERQIIISSMIIHGLRGSREIKYQSWIIGQEKSFTESLAPLREKGTKMLKLDQNLWIFDPGADRTIKIAGHMLRQSMSGSDLSYEDMMEKGKLSDTYDATIVGEEPIDGRDTWILDLKARQTSLAYQQRKIWVDKERYLGIREELYAASGKLLKRLDILETFQTSRGWYPRRLRFKDMLKKGDGTEWIIHSVDFDTPIPDSKFSKAALRR
ncbi:MAG: outer membrane lipoprotein-sorting protein [bacterium]